MLSKTIDLLANMILSEDKIKQEDTRNGIVQLIINRGWDKFLEVLQDHSCRELGRKAENILEIVIKYSER